MRTLVSRKSRRGSNPKASANSSPSPSFLISSRKKPYKKSKSTQTAPTKIDRVLRSRRRWSRIFQGMPSSNLRMRSTDYTINTLRLVIVSRWCRILEACRCLSRVSSSDSTRNQWTSSGMSLSWRELLSVIGTRTAIAIFYAQTGSLTKRFSRCSQYRGSTVQFNSCLNLSNPQFIASTHPESVPPPRPNVPFKPRAGPYPAIRPPPGQQVAARFRPAPQRHVFFTHRNRDTYYGHRQPSAPAPVAIMANPHRARNTGFPDGRHLQPRVSSYAAASGISAPASNHTPDVRGSRGDITHGRERGPLNGYGVTGAPRRSSPDHGQRDAWGSNQDHETDEAAPRYYHSSGRNWGGYPHPSRGTRGRGNNPTFDRGRGRGGYRGRGRGGSYATVPS